MVGANGGIQCGAAGASWTPSVVPNLAATSLNIEALGSAGFAAVGVFSDPATPTVRTNGVAVSTDGVTWNRLDIGLSRASGYRARYGAFPTATTWYVTSGDFPNNVDNKLTNGQVSRLNSRLSVTYDSGNGQPQITFISTRNLLGRYPGAISKTTDGGQTWTKVFDSNGDFYLNQISCTDANNCFAVGEDGKTAVVIATTNGGTTWTRKMTLRGPFSLNAVQMVSATEIFVSGGTMSVGPVATKEIEGRYYRSTDGGNTWQMSAINGYGYDMSFKDGVGYASAIFKTHTDVWFWA
jgi:hypothetical protein